MGNIHKHIFKHVNTWIKGVFSVMGAENDRANNGGGKLVIE
jgi:hypothetical protein